MTSSSQVKRRLRHAGGANRKPAKHSKAFALFYQDRDKSAGAWGMGQKRLLPGFLLPEPAMGVRAIPDVETNTEALTQIVTKL
jgi:hypothetical protein